MKLRNTITALVATSTLGMAILSGTAQAAGAATYSLSGSGSYLNGSTVSVSITENSAATTVNSAQADLIFDATKMQYLGFSPGSISCPIVVPNTGSISIGCNVAGGTVIGVQILGTVNFKVLVGSGSAIVSMASSSLIVHPADAANTQPTDIWNHATVAGTYNFTTPVAATSTPTPVKTTPTKPPKPNLTTSIGATVTPKPTITTTPTPLVLGTTTKSPTPTPTKSIKEQLQTRTNRHRSWRFYGLIAAGTGTGLGLSASGYTYWRKRQLTSTYGS